MIYILPGMGADHRMFDDPSWQSLSGTRFLDWPAYRQESSIGAIADRVVAEAAIKDGDTLIGSSLGGIVGCEIANKLRLKSLVLIGSAKHPQEISHLCATLRPLASVALIKLLQAAAGHCSNKAAVIFSQGEAPFIRAACTAIFAWGGLQEGRVSLLRIHGAHDHLIPLPSAVDLVLDGAHLIAMTHPRECVEFLRARQIVRSAFEK